MDTSLSEEREQLRNRHISSTLIISSGILCALVYLYLNYLVYKLIPTRDFETDFRRLYSVTPSVEDYKSKYKINVGNYSARNLVFNMKFAPERDPVPFDVNPFIMYLYLENPNGSRLTPRHRVKMPIKFNKNERIGYYTASAIPLYHLKNETDVKVCIEYEGNATYIYGQHFHLRVPKDSSTYYEMENSFSVMNSVLNVAFLIAITQSIVLFKKDKIWVFSVLLEICGYVALLFWKNKQSFWSDAFYSASIALSRALSVTIAIPKNSSSLAINIILILPISLTCFFITRILDVNGSDWISPLPIGVIGPVSMMTIVNIANLFLQLFLLVLMLWFRDGPQMASDLVLIGFSTIICINNLVLDLQRLLTNSHKLVFPSYFYRDRYTTLFGIAFLSLFSSSPVEFGTTASYKRLHGDNV